MNKPKNANELMVIVNKNIDVFIDRSSPIQDKPATKKMIDKNMRYIAKHTGLEKLWSTPEGQESILHAFGESLEHAATMPEMGSIVPFGNTAEFIPSIECYKFALENGNNAPLEDINIVLVHENDKVNIRQTEEDFTLDMQIGIPRKEVIGVVVYATRKDTGKRIGQFYDTDRLLEKAFVHSPGYKKYLQDKADFNRLKVEGKLDNDKNGNQCIKKKGKYGEYCIYERDLVNPYDGPDRPEMLKKAAGKSFFRPFMKTRNAMAMADEWKEDDTIQDEMTMEKAADDVLSKAAGQFETVHAPHLNPDNIVDAEIVVTTGNGTKKTEKLYEGTGPIENNDLENNL